MCIAVVAPAGVQIPDENITACFNGNRDGTGFAYVDDGQVKITKGLFPLSKAIDTYKELFEKHGKDNPILAHFRIATQGKVTPANCHPFAVKGGAFVHNGSFWSIGGRDADKSDTSELAAIFYNIMTKEDVIKAKENLSKDIGGWNKVAFLFDDGTTVLLNEDRWVTSEQGIKYSHGGYKYHYSGRYH